MEKTDIRNLSIQKVRVYRLWLAERDAEVSTSKECTSSSRGGEVYVRGWTVTGEQWGRRGSQSNLKKMKSRGFARGVNLEDVIRGAADFGVGLDEHIQFVIDAMKGIAGELGLDRGFVRAAREAKEKGTFTFAAGALSHAQPSGYPCLLDVPLDGSMNRSIGPPRLTF